MQADSLAFLSVTLPAEALPWPLVAILTVGFFIIIGMVIQKASGFKAYSQDFPTQAAPVVIGLGAFVAASPIIMARMALGMKQMDGTGEYLAACITLAGVGGAMLGIKRFSSPEYKQGQAVVEAAKAAGTPAPGVNVEGNATVEMPVPRQPGGRASDHPASAPPASLVDDEGLPFKGVPDDAGLG